jgi:hypothetical protein
MLSNIRRQYGCLKTVSLDSNELIRRSQKKWQQQKQETALHPSSQPGLKAE